MIVFAHPPGFEILPQWMQTAWPWMLWLGAVIVLASFIGDWWRRRKRRKEVKAKGKEVKAKG